MVENNPLEGLPIFPLEDVCEQILYQNPSLQKRRGELRSAINAIDREFLTVRNRDDVAAAKGRWVRLNDQLDKLNSSVQKLAQTAMRFRTFIGLGYLDGRLCFIRMSDWTGVLDWGAATLRSGNRHYTGVCVLGLTITPEQKELVERQFSEVHASSFGSQGVTVSKPTSGPGRPTSAHLIMRKYRELRSTGNLRETLTATSLELSEWLAAAHPEMPSMSSKTINSHIKEHYWKDTGKEAGNAGKRSSSARK